ncbi:MAG TPA: alkaline phosphatase family protein [Candidatus Angelobacter sp.]|jgi:predicted AlkP superfamily pyrophosphatase or phosphodiesterase
MIKYFRQYSLAVLLLFVFITANAAPQGQKQQAPKANHQKPKLLLVVVVDQFRYDYLLRFRADYHGGIARLLDGGAVFADARYPQFPTVTAIGHSTILSGATPSISGIVGNEWLDRETDEQVTSVSDKSTTTLGNAKGGEGASPHRLLVSTVGDELKMAGRHSKVIGISIKDRAAILPAGHMADAAYWFDNASNHFVSSTYYMKELPAWVEKVNTDQAGAKYKDAEWTAVNVKPGDKPFCSMKKGTGLRYCGTIEHTPFASVLLEDFAEKTITEEKLGTHTDTDVLTVSFSANDYVGHDLGPDSPEVRDISIRTDQLLGKLLDFINTSIGQQNILVVFTADHGVAPVPKVNNDRKMPGGWLSAADYSAKISARLTEKFGKGDWIKSDAYGFLYLNYTTIGKNDLERAEVRRFAAEAARSLPHIARVMTRDDLLSGNESADSVGRAIQLGFYGPRSADLELLPEPYFIFGSAPGTTHSTPYSYDNHVPLIFFGPGIPAGVHYEPVKVNDIAPTLAAVLGVETPSGAVGRILTEIIGEK